MGTNEIPLLPEQRQIIHDLTLQKRATGLSPPELEILMHLEAQESIVPEQSLDDCSDFYMKSEE